MKEHMTTDLVEALGSVGVTVNNNEVEEILLRGVDAFLHQRGVDLPVKYLDRIYIIIHELKSTTNV
jgi:proline racemase